MFQTLIKVLMHCVMDAAKNDILHWFFECNKVKPILNLSPEFRLSLETIIFGILDMHKPTINYCILYLKWFIHAARNACNPPKILYLSFTVDLQFLRKCINVERERANITSGLDHFENSIGCIEKFL